MGIKAPGKGPPAPATPEPEYIDPNRMRPGVQYALKVPHGLTKAEGFTEHPVMIVPPKWRKGSKQMEVLRLDPDRGHLFVDEFMERMDPTFAAREFTDLGLGTRPVRSVFCPEYEFWIGLNCCSYHCEKPCRTHVEEIQKGWYKNKYIPPGALNRRRRHSNSEDE